MELTLAGASSLCHFVDFLALNFLLSFLFLVLASDLDLPFTANVVGTCRLGRSEGGRTTAVLFKATMLAVPSSTLVRLDPADSLLEVKTPVKPGTSPVPLTVLDVTGSGRMLL